MFADHAASLRFFAETSRNLLISGALRSDTLDTSDLTAITRPLSPNRGVTDIFLALRNIQNEAREPEQRRD